MASLSYREKAVLEELFGMGTGYVMDFSNGSFSDFIKDAVNIDVYNDPGYEEYGSKANKLRQIWNQEPDGVVGTLIDALLSYYEDLELKHDRITDFDRKKIAEMKQVALRLKEDAGRIELPIRKEETLQTLLEDINYALQRNKPDLVIDRLHTYSAILLRQICRSNGIEVVDNKGLNLPLHSLAGMLRKKYEKEGVIQSSFTLSAIQNSISLFEKYNSLRNDHSYAHDNDILGTIEAEFAVRIMADFLVFIDRAEKFRKKIQRDASKKAVDDELPF